MEKNEDGVTSGRSFTEAAEVPLPEPSVQAMSDSESGVKIEAGIVALAKEFYQRFNDNEIMTRASALSFVCVFSLVPILLFGVLALSFLFQDPGEANKHVQDILRQMLPGESASRAASDVLNQTHLVENARQMTGNVGLPLIIGITTLLWTGTSLFVSAADSMNAAWEVKETRNFIKLRLVALGVLLGAGVILVASLSISALPSLLWGNNDEGVPLWANLLVTLFAIALDILMFVLIYKVLPDRKISWQAALFSGVITGLLWETFKIAFASYLAHFGNGNNKLYGALGGVVLLLTWIFYSCVVLLAGAEIGEMFHEHREGGVVQRNPQAS